MSGLRFRRRTYLVLVIGLVLLCGAVFAGLWAIDPHRHGVDWRRRAAEARVLVAHPDCSAFEAIRGVRLRITKREPLTVEIRRKSILKHTDLSGYELWTTPDGDYWVPKGGFPGLDFVLAEEATGIYAPVRKGEVVFDCGAHVGSFVRKSLESGAGKVVAVEPDPQKVECLKRTFAAEIGQGRVVVVAKGIWDKDEVLVFHRVKDNIGADNFTDVADGDSSERLPVTTIDTLVHELRLARVDYIKMDIEGSERNALLGARKVISEFKPRLSIAVYHLPGDRFELPALARQFYPAYQGSCTSWPAVLHMAPPQGP